MSRVATGCHMRRIDFEALFTSILVLVSAMLFAFVIWGERWEFQRQYSWLKKAWVAYAISVPVALCFLGVYDGFPLEDGVYMLRPHPERLSCVWGTAGEPHVVC